MDQILIYVTKVIVPTTGSTFVTKETKSFIEAVSC